jgi:hypothetical protein
LKKIQISNPYEVKQLVLKEAVCATAGFVGAWFAISPNSALSNRLFS